MLWYCPFCEEYGDWHGHLWLVEERLRVAFTDDKDDPRLGHGWDEEAREPQDVYLVLSEDERKKPYVRMVRKSYVHDACDGVTMMATELAETYARDPHFYGATYCVHCKKHRPVAEFKWLGTDERVGS